MYSFPDLSSFLGMVMKRRKPVFVQHRTVGADVYTEVITNMELPKFEYSNPIHGDLPAPVGYLEGLQLYVDSHCQVPRQRVSDAFRTLQDPTLVKETDEWLASFFGYEYPIYVHEDRVIMHPRVLEEYMNKHVYVWG